jgi:hypothetical protein
MQDSDSRPISNRLLALRPPSVETRRLITEKLHGAATSSRWLPEGLSDEIDQRRDEHAQALAQVRGALAAVDQLAAKHRVEDKEHDLALTQAARAGDLDWVEDRRSRPRSARASATSRWKGCGPPSTLSAGSSTRPSTRSAARSPSCSLACGRA